MRRALLVVALALPLIAAAPAPPPFTIANPSLSWPCTPIAVHIDTPAAPDRYAVAEVTNAYHDWLRATGRSWPLTAGPAAVTITWSTRAHGYGGITDLSADDTHYAGATVVLDPAATPYALRPIVLHELAHVAGLAHTQDPGSLMGPYGGRDYGAGDLLGLAVVDWRCHRRKEA